MKMRMTVSCVIALMLCVPHFMSEAFAQAGTPGTKQLRDVQRKAEQKARANQSQQTTTQHHTASAPAAAAPATPAAPASAP